MQSTSGYDGDSYMIIIFGKRSIGSKKISETGTITAVVLLTWVQKYVEK